MSGPDRLLRWGAAAVLLVFGFLPIANWIPGGYQVIEFGLTLQGWLKAVTFTTLFGFVMALWSRRRPMLWREGALHPLLTFASDRPIAMAVFLGCGALLLNASIAWWVFGGTPLIIDEVVQVWHARLLAEGRLWVPTPALPEFSSILHLVDHEGKRFGQFPIGGPAMLALGSIIGNEWLVGPAFGAVSAAIAWLLFRRIESRQGVALAAAVLFTVAPFTAFMAGSHMNHVTVLTWLMVAMLGLARATGPETSRWSDGLLCGLGLGMAASIRPMDAMAFALPAAIWLGWQGVRRRRHGAFVAAGLGVAIPLAVLFASNAVMTGSPFQFGYSLLWGSAHDPGFHQPPWGPMHTPLRGLEQISLYLYLLQPHLFETPVPALLFLVVGLLFHKHCGAFDRYLMAASGILLLSYFGYWHDGFYLGPRFLYALLPVFALWTARTIPAIRAGAGEFSGRAASFAVIPLGAAALLQGIPARAEHYRGLARGLHGNASQLVEQAQLAEAVVLVRGTWGEEIQARLIGAGVRRRDVERAYRNVDICTLDGAMLAMERHHLDPDSALLLLVPLMSDSARLVADVGITSDPSAMFLPDASYPARCVSRLTDDNAGTIHYPTFALLRSPRITYLRDLRERNALLADHIDARPIYLLRLQRQGDDWNLTLSPVPRDSL